jgi:hypothetical protein
LEQAMLLGLGGRALSGKDATADILQAEGFQRTYMSRALEKALLVLNPWIPEEHVKGDGIIHLLRTWAPYQEIHERIGYDASKLIPEVRRLLMILGTAVGREMFGQDVWVNAAFRQVDAWMDEGQDVAITGIRFPNELAAIRRRKGVAVWVDRGLPPLNDHASENTLSVDDFDMVLPNLGTLDDLGVTVRGMFFPT